MPSFATFVARIDAALATFVTFAWGKPLILLLVGGGLFLLIFSRGRPYRHLGHSIGLLRGKYNNSADPGQITHAQALSTALSGTLGLGNIAGVALAITMGGPGAIFWMWLTAIVGVATKFYTASLAVMYRGRDAAGILQGGPMYVIREALPKAFYPLALLFALAGLCANVPIFQANQTTELLRESFALPMGWISAESGIWFNFAVGVVLMAVSAVIIAGRIQRIGSFAVRLVPAMVLFYLALTLIVIGYFWQHVPAVFALIFTDAFTGKAVAGGALGSVIQIGVSRGAFSNEAGLGTESMAHGAAKTKEPIREGVVAMVGPIVDTLIVCTCTALVILLTGVWQRGGAVEGVKLTASAFTAVFGHWGPVLLLIMVVPLAISTIIANWYYGVKCLNFLFNGSYQRFYTPVYLLLIVVGAIASISMVNSLILGMYAIMAIPTMTSTLLLSGRVNRAASEYFSAQAAGNVISSEQY